MELLLFYIALALVVSFFCSLAEATLLSVTPAHIETVKVSHPRKGVRLAALKGRIERPLATILTWNTIANTLGATGAGAQFARLYGAGHAVVFALALAAAILVFSEIIPKTLGARYWRTLASPVALALTFFTRLSLPFVAMACGITRRFGGDKRDDGVSRDEILAMTLLGERQGTLDPRESHIVANLLRLRTGRVSDIMTPRTVVYFRPAAMTVAEFIADGMDTPFTRIPLFGRDTDDITGFVLKGDVLQARVRGENDRPLSDLQRPIKAIPAKSNIARLFQTLLEEKQHLMLVVDEFGNVEGVVTLEDVVETLLGLEIVDEADRAADLQKLARRLWRQRARKMGLPIENHEN